MDEKRLYYLDMARGLAIILVIVGHMLPQGELNIFITSFHVPLFFIVSGSLIKYKGKKKINLSNSIKRLVVPYLMFSLLIMPFWLFSWGWNLLNLKGIMFSFLSGLGIGALWFLPAIFIAENLFLFIISKFDRKRINAFLILLLTLIALISSNITFNNIIFDSLKLIIVRSVIGMSFLSVGYYAFDKINKSKISSKILVICSIIFAIAAIYNKQVDLYSLFYNNKILYFTNAIALSLISILILKNIAVNIRILTYSGINSLTLMATHQALMIVISKVTNIRFDTYFKSLIMFVVVMILEIAIIKIINSHFPWITGKFKSKKEQKSEMLWPESTVVKETVGR